MSLTVQSSSLLPITLQFGFLGNPVPIHPNTFESAQQRINDNLSDSNNRQIRLGAPTRENQADPSRLQSLMQKSVMNSASCIGSLAVGMAATMLTQNPIPIVLLATNCIEIAEAKPLEERLAEEGEKEKVFSKGVGILSESKLLKGAELVPPILDVPFTIAGAWKNQKDCVEKGHDGLGCAIGNIASMGAEATFDAALTAQIVHGIGLVELGLAGAPAALPLAAVGAGEILTGTLGLAVGSKIARKIGDAIPEIPDQIEGGAIAYAEFVSQPAISFTKMGIQAWKKSKEILDDFHEIKNHKQISQNPEKRLEIELMKKVALKREKARLAAKRRVNKIEREIKTLITKLNKIRESGKHTIQTAQTDYDKKNEFADLKQKAIIDLWTQITNADKAIEGATNSYNTASAQYNKICRECGTACSAQNQNVHPAFIPLQQFGIALLHANGYQCTDANYNYYRVFPTQIQQMSQGVATALTNMNQAVIYRQTLQSPKLLEDQLRSADASKKQAFENLETVKKEAKKAEEGALEILNKKQSELTIASQLENKEIRLLDAANKRLKKAKRGQLQFSPLYLD